MRLKTAAFGMTLVGVGSLAVLAAAGVQQPLRQSAGDPLVQEVRQLREAIERSAATSAQIELTVQRANAVQMRISSLSWELADVRTQLSRAVAEVTRNSALMSQEHGMPNVMAEAKRQAESWGQFEQQLRTRESQIVAALGTEQAKWNELSRRLDELERTVVGK